MKDQIFKQFCTQKLAFLIWSCTNRSKKHTADIDWEIATSFLNKNPHILSHVIIQAQINCDCHLPSACCYDKFEQKFGRYIWDKCWQKIKYELPTDVYISITHE